MKILHNYISIEGVSGTGKSTSVEFLSRRLSGRQVASAIYHDPPADNPLGVCALDCWKSAAHYSQESLHLLFASASIDAQMRYLKRLSGSPSVLVTDRCPFSTYAYLESIDIAHFLEVHQDFQFPALTVFLEIDRELALKRLVERDESSQYRRLFCAEFGIVSQRYKEIINHAVQQGCEVISYAVERSFTPDKVAEHIESLVLSHLSRAMRGQVNECD